MTILSHIGAFFSTIWHVLDWLRRMTANILFIALIVLALVALLADSTVTVPQHAILLLDPSGRLVEEAQSPQPLEALMDHLSEDASLPEETRVQDMIDAVLAAATDPHILALSIDPSEMLGCDTSKLVDLGAAIRTFKHSGKPVFAHSAAFSQGQYLLASYADHVSVSPLGGVALTGFGLYQTYFKGLLDKAHINFHIFRIGEHKTAVEPFTRQDMSPEAKEDGQAWIAQLWQTYADEVATSRGISPNTVTDYVQRIDQGLAQVRGNAALLAQQSRLVDAIQTAEQYEQTLADKLGLTPEDLNPISSRDYLRLAAPTSVSGPCVAIVRGRGAIVPGKQDESMIGSESMIELLRQAQDDPDIAAVVLRLDSPGGSASASEDIALELEALRTAGKPVVVSMGSVAASGAYWIASAADRIVATPSTLTGSIGIFAALPTFEDTAKAWGVTTDGVATSPLAGLGNPLLPLPPVARASIQHLLHFGYTAFLDRVVRGRGLTPEQAEASAQGKVFTGQEALERRLVDHLGTLDTAVRVAGELAELNAPQTRELRRQLSPRESLLQEVAESKSRIFGATLPPALATLLKNQLRLFATFTDPGHIYARSLECEAVGLF